MRDFPNFWARRVSLPFCDHLSSDFYYHTLDLTVVELHINGIRQCALYFGEGEGLASFTQHVFEIYPCSSMKSSLLLNGISLYGYTTFVYLHPTSLFFLAM